MAWTLMAWLNAPASRACVLMSALLLSACGDAVPVICDRPNTPEPLPYNEGTTEACVYMSADWGGDLLHYPGGTWYQFIHNLGLPRVQCDVYLSFERDGLTSGSLSLAAGDQAVIKAIDDNSITILNASCVEYWVLVTCTGPPNCAGP
jgi:hypothetical protein